MEAILLMLAALAPARAVVAPAAPTAHELSQAVAQARGAPPRISRVRCRDSSPGYVRCTYLELTGKGYTRWAVLVSPHDGRWTVSEGPIREKAPDVRR
jgi:hypothetical protein